MNDKVGLGDAGGPDAGGDVAGVINGEPDLILLARIAEDAVVRVGELLVSRHGDRSRNVKSTHGAALDYATQTDIDAERMLRDALSITGIPVHGEEEDGGDPLSGWCWVVDPIDGTLNWANNLPLCAVSVGLCENGIPRLGVILTPGLRRRVSIGIVGLGAWVDGEQISVSSVPAKEAVVAYDGFRDLEKDISKTIRSAVGRCRLIGSTATEMALCANGGFGAVVAPEAMFWDVAAGIALIRAAGGVAVDLNGAPHMPGSGSVIAGAGHVVAAIIDALGGNRTDADREHDDHRHLRERGSAVSHLERIESGQHGSDITSSCSEPTRHHQGGARQGCDWVANAQQGPSHDHHTHENHPECERRLDHVPPQQHGHRVHQYPDTNGELQRQQRYQIDANGCVWGPDVQNGGSCHPRQKASDRNAPNQNYYTGRTCCPDQSCCRSYWNRCDCMYSRGDVPSSRIPCCQLGDKPRRCW